MSATESAYLTIESSQPIGIRQLAEDTKKFQDLITLSMDRPCGVRHITYLSPKPIPEGGGDLEAVDPYDRYYRLDEFANRTYRSAQTAEIGATYESLFTLFELTFENVVPRWYELYDRITVGLQLVSGIRYRDEGYISSRLMTVCTAVEAIHFGLYDHPKFGDTEFDVLLTEALAGITSDSHSEFVERRLTNTLSYRRRAIELASKVDSEAAKTLIGKSRVWADVLTKHRNDLAHAAGEGSSPALEYFLLVLTHALLVLVIGAELGLSPEAQRNFVGKHWYRSAKFKELTGQAPPTSD